MVKVRSLQPGTASTSHPRYVTMGTMTSLWGGAGVCQEAATLLMRLEAEAKLKDKRACKHWRGNKSEFRQNSQFVHLKSWSGKILFVNRKTQKSDQYQSIHHIMPFKLSSELISTVPGAQKISWCRLVFIIPHYYKPKFQCSALEKQINPDYTFIYATCTLVWVPALFDSDVCVRSF